MSELLNIKETEQHLREMKTYFPDYLTENIDLQQACADAGLNDRKCERLGERLGENFFTTETPPTIPATEYALEPRQDSFFLQNIVLMDELPIVLEASCDISGKFNISSIDNDESLLFSGAMYARVRSVMNCDYRLLDVSDGHELMRCESQRGFEMKGLVEFDPQSEKIHGFKPLEEYTYHLSLDCPVPLPYQIQRIPTYDL